MMPGDLTDDEVRQLLRSAKLQLWVDEERERVTFGHLESAIRKLETWRLVNDTRAKASVD